MKSRRRKGNDEAVQKKAGKSNDPDEKPKPGRKKRSFVLSDIWSVRAAMQTLLNEIRNDEWDAPIAAQQRQCLESIGELIRISDVEKLLQELKAEITAARSGYSIGARRR
jgi:hypothetical protein